MTNQSTQKSLNSEEFLQRNIQLHRNNFSTEFVTTKASELAAIIADEIKKYGGSYEDVNQAVILVDNGFYKKTLKTNHHIETSE